MVALSTANLSGEPTLQHLQQGAGRVHGLVRQYLVRHGYEVVPDHVFDNAWNQAVRTYGNMYDPTTGRVDPQTWRAVMVTTAATLREQGDIDAIVRSEERRVGKGSRTRCWPRLIHTR